jgi:hypothetical protein
MNGGLIESARLPKMPSGCSGAAATGMLLRQEGFARLHQIAQGGALHPGKVERQLSMVSISAAAISRANHLLSAGMTYHGACSSASTSRPGNFD